MTRRGAMARTNMPTSPTRWSDGPASRARHHGLSINQAHNMAQRPANKDRSEPRECPKAVPESKYTVKETVLEMRRGKIRRREKPSGGAPLTIEIGALFSIVTSFLLHLHDACERPTNSRSTRLHRTRNRRTRFDTTTC